MNSKHQLTLEGFKKLEKELEDLKNVERARIIESLKEARAQGDLSENADYDAARDEQARLEARILELEGIIKNVEIIDSNSKKSSNNMGKVVELVFDNKNVKKFTLVGSIESDPMAGKISNESPLGAAIMYLKKGETALVKSETGKETYVTVKNIY
ncbi:MAG: transcription elongation factor GreA [Bacilli bacterium]|nr:transcription elongation factor GreA [Bacilli bacterium]